MKIVNIVLRVLVGLMMLVFGANKFFNFIPMEHPEGLAGEVMAGFAKSGYIFPVVGLIEIIIGIAFLLNKMMPLATLIMLPLSINFIGFHLVADMAGIPGAAFVFLVNVYFIIRYKDKYMSLLKE